MNGVGVDDIFYAHHGGADQGGLVDAANHGSVRVGVDQPGRDVAARSVNFHRAARRFKILANPAYFPAPEQNIGLFKNAVIAGGPHRGAAQQNVVGLVGNGAVPRLDVVGKQAGRKSGQGGGQNNCGQFFHAESSSLSGPLVQRALRSKLPRGLAPSPVARSRSISRLKLMLPGMPRPAPSMRTFSRLPNTRASASGTGMPMTTNTPDSTGALPLSFSSASMSPISPVFITRSHFRSEEHTSELPS